MQTSGVWLICVVCTWALLDQQFFQEKHESQVAVCFVILGIHGWTAKKILFFTKLSSYHIHFSSIAISRLNTNFQVLCITLMSLYDVRSSWFQITLISFLHFHTSIEHNFLAEIFCSFILLFKKFSCVKWTRYYFICMWPLLFVQYSMSVGTTFKWKCKQKVQKNNSAHYKLKPHISCFVFFYKDVIMLEIS